ncbi:DegT/DnrJ/EryC1/StrS family aminotransferase [Curvibacter sp. RS43]|uniref:DegT/DnrJ/EryC1/StrS family aminotransferase n=1 Tax=Curvibacter microcysteis TaxID=3026419 RepID=UPI00235ED676|nr:DegT/DnrJ/EryC1/StrS family aminotransferase [Curvibacter sp. RS43]MDD0808779.1 DegT/DnrJ/EryC1/StrS family aminotransferase [Curvibacter sp. RS43]
MMLKLSQPNISEEAIAAVADVIRSGQLVHGTENEAFEKELAAYLGCEDVVLVSSGTAALHLALLALDIGPNDAVLVPDFTFPATANAVALVGARPVIVDVDPNTYTLSARQLEAVIQTWKGPERLRAIMPVHEFGCPADMQEINRIAKAHGLFVVEDAACALGATFQGRKLGTLGDIGCFSFHPRKTLTTGEGGALCTNDAELARRLRRLRNHGMERTASGMQFFEPATNYRLTNFQAALGRHQLPQLDGWIERRSALAKAYCELLQPLAQTGRLSLPSLIPGHSWQTFMVVLDGLADRNAIILQLRNEGVEANLGAQSLSSIGLYGPVAQDLKYGPLLYQHGLALPLFEKLSLSDVQHVVKALGTLISI